MYLMSKARVAVLVATLAAAGAHAAPSFAADAADPEGSALVGDGPIADPLGVVVMPGDWNQPTTPQMPPAPPAPPPPPLDPIQIAIGGVPAREPSSGPEIRANEDATPIPVQSTEDHHGDLYDELHTHPIEEPEFGMGD